MKAKLPLALFTLSLLQGAFHLCAQPSAFTYQGQLNDNGQPATGTYDLVLALFDAGSGGDQLGGRFTNAAVAVSNGLFAVTLDFGSQPFDGARRWLEIAVRTNGGGDFSVLSARQEITTAPYAITAAKLTGPLPSTGLSGTYDNAVAFANAANSFTGSFIGDGAGMSNVNAGAFGGLALSNFWLLNGNGGGTANRYLGTSDYEPLELRVNKARAIRITPTTNGWPNLLAGASSSSIAADVTGATIAGGITNSIADVAGSSVIAGGKNNLLAAHCAGSVIGGGQWNLMQDGSVRSVIAGGYSNTIRGATGTNAPATARAITDGTSNTLLLGETPPGNAAIGGGYANLIGSNCTSANIAGGQFNQIGDGSVRSVISGGNSNFIGRISDGSSQTILIGETPAGNSCIGGGYGNRIGSNCAAVAVGGGLLNSVGDGSVRTVIVGGCANTAGSNCNAGVISGGESNRLGDGSVRGFVGGGRLNDIRDGTSNTLLAGEENEIAGADYAVIGGGRWNTNRGLAATIPGGSRNYASGNYSFVSGRRGRALHDGCFVWADAQDADFASIRSNEFSVRADGSVRFITSGAGMTLDGQPVLAGSNGAALTNLNASQLAAGILPDARLSASVALRNAANIFAGTQVITGGQLGIGTTDPSARLHISTAVSEPAALMLTSGGSWGLSLSQSAASVMVVSNGGQGRLFMPATGNVGIGNTNPLHKLHVGVFGSTSTINNSPQKAVVENTNENGRATLLVVAGPGATPDTTNRVEVALEVDENQRIGLLGTMSAHPLQIRVDNATRMFFGTNGNVGVGTTTPASALQVVGTVTATAFNPPSDRNLKENFTGISPLEVLDKVVAMPITRWNFRGDANTPHVGPMAQDFYAAFGLGTDDKHIATVDADGVALAAIQGIHQKLEQENHRLRAELQVRDTRLAALETAVADLREMLLKRFVMPK